MTIRHAIPGFCLALAWLALIQPAPVLASNGQDTPVGATTMLMLVTQSGRDLGAVIDVRNPDPQGLKVLAVSPGSIADGIGLRADDRLQAVNGQSLVDSAQPGPLLDLAIARNPDRIEVQVLRDDVPVALSGALTLGAGTPGAATAATTGCGYVSTLGPTPHMSENIHRAELIRINGRSTPLQPVNRHRLPAGRHVLTVGEQINQRRLNSAQSRQIHLLKRQGQSRIYKALIVDISPDTTQFIGAQLLPDQLDHESIRANNYWEPVAWRETGTPCN